jgi:3-dehydroquinate dehydratase II
MAKHILLINGPNLNLLGRREPTIYGPTTLSSLKSSLRTHCASLSPPVHLTTYQSNHEGEIIDVIHRCRYPELVDRELEGVVSGRPNPTEDDLKGKESKGIKGVKDIKRLKGIEEEEEEEEGKAEIPPVVDAILINAGGLTHTSIVLRDALAGVAIPYIEIHITNVHARDAFRHQSYLSEKAVAVICGLGVFGYRAAVDYCVGYL